MTKKTSEAQEAKSAAKKRVVGWEVPSKTTATMVVRNLEEVRQPRSRQQLPIKRVSSVASQLGFLVSMGAGCFDDT